MRRDRESLEEIARVRVFIDHWEFSLSWQIAYSGFTGNKLTHGDLRDAQIKSQDISWDLLPDAVLEHLDEMEYISDFEKEIKNVDVYASAKKSGDQKAYQAFIEWLEGSLDPLPGFQVHHFTRKSDGKDLQCDGCGASIESPELEKGLKTKMACDLLSYAVKDLYDIAVVFADDAELAPSILCVQEVFDKKVIHVGLTSRGQVLRSSAWGHIKLNDLMRDLFKPEDFKRKTRR